MSFFLPLKFYGYLLKYNKGEFMGRKIVITSGKGGVGKTTITAGLGAALAELGSSVCMVDLDFGLNNLDLVLNLEDKVVYDLSDCISGKCRLKQALIPEKQKDNLFYLPSGKISSAQNIDESKVAGVINKLSQVFDYCLIDSPAGIGNGFLLASGVADEFILVATPNISSLRDASKIKNLIVSSKSANIGLVVNRIRGDLVMSKKMIDEDQMAKALDVKLLGVIPESDDIFVMNNLKSVYECGAAIKGAFDVLAKNVNFNKKVKFDYLSKYKGIVGAIMCKLKKNA